MHVSLSDLVSLVCMPRSGIAGSYGISIVKQITSPGWMHETSARAWCTGKTQRNLVEREVGGGIGMGIHVTPWLIHVNV